MGDLLLEDDFKRKEDLNLLLKALRNRWEIPEAVKRKMLLKAGELLEHHDPRVVTKAIQVLTSMEAQKQKDDHKYLEALIEASQEKVTNNNFTQIAVGDLDGVYQLLDKMSGSSKVVDPSIEG